MSVSFVLIFDEYCEEVDEILNEKKVETFFFSCEILEFCVCALIELRSHGLQFAIKGRYKWCFFFVIINIFLSPLKKTWIVQLCMN